MVADGSCQATAPDFTIADGTELANSVTEFSGTQGQDDWYYGMYAAFDHGNFSQLPNYTGSHWSNPGTSFNLPVIDASGGHPDLDNLLWAVRRPQVLKR